MEKTLLLPKGYYFVGNEIKNNVSFRNVNYKIEEGKNYFYTFKDAIENANEIPDEVLPNLSGYSSFNCPVILVAKGEYSIDNISINKTLYMIGDEAYLKGTFWHGNIETKNNCDSFTIDSFIFENIRLNDYRSQVGDFYLNSKNIKYVGVHPWISYLVGPKNKDTRIHLSLENIVVDSIDGYYYGNEFMRIYVASLFIDNLIFTNTDKLFGFSSFDKKFSNAEKNIKVNYKINNAIFKNNKWQKGITFNSTGVSDISFNNCIFENCLLDDTQSLFDFSMDNNDKLSFYSSTFNEKNKKFITGKIKNEQLTIVDSKIDGFIKNDINSFIFDEKNLLDYYVSMSLKNIDDPLEIVDADFSKLEDYYENRKPFYCDMHVHSKSGGTSDGWVDIADWPKEMKDMHIDFVAIADHRQMRHFFLKEFDDTKFFYCTEPAAMIKGDMKYNELHYNMIFPDKYGLKKVLQKFDDLYKFKGDELTGHFDYFEFSHYDLENVAKYISEIGGMFVHAHPKGMLVSDNILDYYFGEYSYIEIFSHNYSSLLSYNDYKLWVGLLSFGKKVYNISGCDSHAHCMNSCIDVVYAEERINTSLFKYFKKGDFSSGAFGIKMMLNDTPMGSTNNWIENQKLLVEIDDLFDIYEDKNKMFIVKIVSDKGAVYSTLYDGKNRLRIALNAKRRKFYRVEIIDLDSMLPFGLSNPIWID